MFCKNSGMIFLNILLIVIVVYLAGRMMKPTPIMNRKPDEDFKRKFRVQEEELYPPPKAANEGKKNSDSD